MINQEWLDKFGDYLKNIMVERGHTQESLSREAGLTQGTISKYINKKRIPSLKAIINLSYALGCSVDDLIFLNNKII